MSFFGEAEEESPEIQCILDRYLKVFTPSRGFEHTVDLEQGAKSMIITPYRHSKVYKDEIKR